MCKIERLEYHCIKPSSSIELDKTALLVCFCASCEVCELEQIENYIISYR